MTRSEIKPINIFQGLFDRPIEDLGLPDIVWQEMGDVQTNPELARETAELTELFQDLVYVPTQEDLEEIPPNTLYPPEPNEVQYTLSLISPNRRLKITSPIMCLIGDVLPLFKKKAGTHMFAFRFGIEGFPRITNVRQFTNTITYIEDYRAYPNDFPSKSTIYGGGGQIESPTFLLNSRHYRMRQWAGPYVQSYPRIDQDCIDFTNLRKHPKSALKDGQRLHLRDFTAFHFVDGHALMLSSDRLNAPNQLRTAA